MKKNRTLILLILISLLALFLRLWKLGSVPPSLNWDEASWGYNAYSILKTGRDEYGEFFPFILKSLGDFKPAFYVYLVAASEAIFGVNEFAVRLPAALFGTLSIFPIFLITKELFTEFKKKEVVALIASAVWAFLPWDYHYSHSAWENNVLVFFALLALWFFLKALNRNYRFFYLSAFLFGFCLYIYQSAKILVPLIILGLLIFNWRKVVNTPRRIIGLSLAVLIVISGPMFFSAFLGDAGGRLKIMSIFSYSRPLQEAAEIAKEENGTPNSLEFRIFHGGFNYYLRGITGRYLNYFSPKFLFFEGDWTNPRHSTASAGVLNFLDILFIPAGIYFLISRKIKNQSLVWYLLFITPLPAALTRDVIQATRSFFMIIPLSIVSAFGVYFIWEKVVKVGGIFKIGIISVLIFGYLFSFVYYLDQFFIHAPIQNSQYWQYGYKEAVDYIRDKTDQYGRVIFTQKYGQPYIYWLFYTQYPPRQYQLQARLTEYSEGDVDRVEKIDNIEFRDIYWPSDRYLKNTLFVGGPYELPEQDIIPQESKLIKKIMFLNGETAFHIVETVK